MKSLDHTGYAIIKCPDSGELIIGMGPFNESAEHPLKGVAFYVNDFYLNDTKPWKIPSSYHTFDASFIDNYMAAEV